MGILKNILTLLGAIFVAVLVVAFVKFGGKMNAVSSLDPQAMGLYMDMFNKVLETGDSATAMSRKVKINDDISTEDVVENLKSIASENNFLVVGDSKMQIKTSIKEGGERYIRILSFCSPSIAKQFISYSLSYGAFMPCRILIVEDDKGDRWLYTMAMELMLHGGKPLPPEMLKMANSVKNLMYGMMDAAATDGDYEAPEE